MLHPAQGSRGQNSWAPWQPEHSLPAVGRNGSESAELIHLSGGTGAATDPCKIVLIFSCLVDLSYVYGIWMYMATYGNKNQTTHLRLTKIGPRNGAKYLDDSQVEQLNQWELIGIENTYSRVVW